MTSRSATTAEAASATAGPFVVTLCRVAVPVSVRPYPQASSFRPFVFFTSRSSQPDGSERLYLQMGYFETLEDARKWERRMRPKYPQAIAMRAPEVLLGQASSRVPTLRAAAREPGLTGAQAMQVLETRPIAVVPGVPDGFALQLQWSVEPIDLASVPPLDIFRAYTLYVSECRRERRSWFSLRLGFFSGALSAKQVAQYMRSSFASVSIVPVSKEERSTARDSAIDRSALAPRHPRS